MARSRKKTGKGPAPAKPTKKPAKAKGKAKRSPPPPVKPAPVRTSPVQQRIPETADPNASPELDALVRAAFDATATWQAAAADCRAARAKLTEAMKAKGLQIYKTDDDGYVAKITMSAEKLQVKRTDNVREVDLDDDDVGDDSEVD